MSYLGPHRASPLSLTVAVAALMIGVATLAPQPANAQTFGYACETCPANWGNLDADFEACRIGKSQSPIDISDVKRRRLPRLRFDYEAAVLEPVDKVVNIELESEVGSIRVGSTIYDLLQFHFHSLSEHFLFGNQLPLEMHLVHQAADGRLAVVARFIRVGDALDAFDGVIDAIEAAAGGTIEEVEFDLTVVVPDSKKSFRYTGSTTTPPCSEDVLWIAIKEPLYLSQEQIERIQDPLRDLNDGFDNFRPMQSRNGRKILTDARKSRDTNNDDDDDDDD